MNLRPDLRPCGLTSREVERIVDHLTARLEGFALPSVRGRAFRTAIEIRLLDALEILEEERAADLSAGKDNCLAPEVHLLGEVVVAFGNLEFFIEVAIWKLLHPKDEPEQLMAQALTAEMNFGRKVHALGSMFRQRNIADAESDLKNLIKELFDVEAERNKLMHSTWLPDFRGEGSLWRTKASAKAKGLTRQFYLMSAEGIKTALNHIEEVSQLLGLFAQKYIQAPE
ncbi:MAG TPA: hypothetical protein VKM72_08055 [Thermoanaerobaculia bacterium]|nr:hypothetical protein [Thermoanaerobaculia bacterium]